MPENGKQASWRRPLNLFPSKPVPLWLLNSCTKQVVANLLVLCSLCGCCCCTWFSWLLAFSWWISLSMRWLYCRCNVCAVDTTTRPFVQFKSISLGYYSFTDRQWTKTQRHWTLDKTNWPKKNNRTRKLRREIEHKSTEARLNDASFFRYSCNVCMK